jgi:hypothetical protein
MSVNSAVTYMRESYNKKTWKRESAFLLLGVLCYEIITNSFDMVALILLPILGYASGMFGLDVYSKLQQFTRVTPDAGKRD